MARLDLVIELGGQISGQMMDQDGPITYFRVFLYPVGGENAWAENFQYDYSFNLTGLPDGDYVLGAKAFYLSPSMEEMVWYPGTFDRQEAQVIQIRNASVVEGADIIIPR